MNWVRMVEEEEYKNARDDRDSLGEGEGFSVSGKSDKKKKKKRLQQQRLQAEEELEIPGESPVVEKSGKKKTKKRHSSQNSVDSEVGFESDVKSSKKGRKRKHRSVEKVVKAEEEEEERKSEGFEEEDEERGRDPAMSDGEEEMLDIGVDRENGDDDDDEDDDYDEEEDLSLQKELKEHLLQEAAKAKKRGILHMSVDVITKVVELDLENSLKAYKNAVREQKLALEIAAAKRERDFYLKKVDQHRAQTAIKDRLEKKQKVQEAPKFIRQFPQRKPVGIEAEKSKPKLSTDVLAGVFGGS
ncbi:hypothetical protein Tsubulata_043939 [Turnera subulata]|uniref:Uncharacterized protein n=1 Tax=Turnera subulata TaxID=218843 RepID=A0A9Q0FE79_9ROSI|nr:hypothetical protein Tsubulata_043939 [Turnera subulata]